MPRYISSKTWYRLTRCTNAQTRQAEALGVIKPLRAEDSGYRLFSEEDVTAMNAWPGNQRKSRPRRSKRKAASRAVVTPQAPAEG